MEFNLLFCTFSLLVHPILCGKSEIVLRDPAESWILNENFTTIIKLSFPYAKCCNVYLNDSSEEVHILFNRFKDAYQNGYTLNQRSYECQGYLLLASIDTEIVEAMNGVPVFISTTEILIIVNDITKSNSSIFDSSLYGNADINIISLSGMWSLSENYLEPRIFDKHSRYDEMVHEYDKIDFQGRELQVSTFYRPPVSYVNRTINTTIRGVEAKVFLADNDVERDGIELKLFLLMAKKLNFTWTIREPEGPHRYGRRVNDSQWTGGMVQMLLDNVVDVAFASMWVTADSYVFVNLTEPWYQLFIHFLVPRPRPITSFWAVIRPFPVKVWILLVCALLMHSLYTYGRAWIDPKFPKRFRNFLTTLIDLIGCLLGTSIPKNIPRVKVQMLLWQVAGWLIITAYSSSLAARLASSDYEERIDTVQQFLSANLMWGRTVSQPPFNEYFDLTDPYCSQLPSRFIYLPNNEAVREYIGTGKYAILGKIIDTTFFPEDYVPNDDLKNYRVMKEMVRSYYSAFAVQPWLLKPMNKIILSLRESGIILMLMRDVIRRRDSFTLRETVIELDKNDEPARVLGLTPLVVGFLILVTGVLISTFVFYLELKHNGSSTTKGNFSQDIKCSRKRRVPMLMKDKRKSGH